MNKLKTVLAVLFVIAVGILCITGIVLIEQVEDQNEALRRGAVVDSSFQSFINEPYQDGGPRFTHALLWGKGYAVKDHITGEVELFTYNEDFMMWTIDQLNELERRRCLCE